MIHGSGSGSSAIAVGVVVDGKYRVDAVIGQGGMGAVFRAWDLRLERAVAIKVVRADLLSDPDSRARFRRESQIVARLQHPAIVTVFDYGTLPDGAAFLVMEFVPGEDLRHLHEAGRPAGGRRACRRCCTALPPGSSRRTSPASSIAISSRKTSCCRKAARDRRCWTSASRSSPTQSMTTDGGTLTVGGTIVGTPAYMAPEQLRGDAVDGRADVFSLGVMAYEMLTARLPYGGGSFIDIGMKQAAGEQQVDTGDIPPALADVDSPRDCLRERQTASVAGRLRERRRGREVKCEVEHDSYFLLFYFFFLFIVRQPPFDLGHRLADLIAAGLVRRHFELALQLGAGQAERFHLPRVLGVDLRAAILRNLAGFLEFVHALLQARFSVNQSFSSITHEFTIIHSARRVCTECTGRLCTMCTDCAHCVSQIAVVRIFHPAVAEWFHAVFAAATAPQKRGWPAIARGESTLILAPTGSGKTLTAFLWSLNRLMFEPVPEAGARCRVLYISPLKALAVDVERNLRAPLAGIANVAAGQGMPFHTPAIAVRTGDTPAAERAKFQRAPADILITTPESLFLLLTSNARESLRSVETVIIDEIHALVSTKRGAHLALSLERLERIAHEPLQRIGLSATQRPLDEVARFLGGASVPDTKSTKSTRSQGTKQDASRTDFADSVSTTSSKTIARVKYRPVTIVDASAPKKLAITVQTPIEDMAAMGKPVEQPSGPAAQGPVAQSIWSSIHPRLLELIRSHRSTLLFVNSRRLAERLAGALNELAGEPLVRAHHGSLARAQRTEIEDLLKAGHLRALVATSSLELGIDMGAIDLVIQIEAPPSVASGLQRIGRAGHSIDEVSEGIIFPKFRGDLVACAAVTAAMRQGKVESSRYPRNPLDVLAQQLVAMASMERWSVDDLYRTVRSRGAVRRVEPADLRGRARHAVGPLSLRRVRRAAAARHVGSRERHGDGAAGRQARGHRQRRHDSRSRALRRVPGRRREGQGARRRARRGDGVRGARRRNVPARRLDVAHRSDHARSRAGLPGAGPAGQDAVLEGRRPGPPDRAGHGHRQAGARSAQAANRRTRSPRSSENHGLDALAAANLLQYLDDQHAAAGAVPDDRTILIERSRDDLGDWRVAVLTPLGSRVHAPWAMAVTARLRDEAGLDAEVMWSDDGFVVRYPDGERPPDTSLLVPDPDEVERLVVRQLGSTAMFAARFREAAGRALLLPRRRPGARAPLWQQRKRAVGPAGRGGALRIVPDHPRDLSRVPARHLRSAGADDLLTRIRSRTIRVVTVESRTPSPFAASLLFGYVANYLYDGDAPLAERRAQALSVDQSQLRELIGDAELRDLLDEAVLEAVERELQHLPPRFHARSTDAVHDLLLRLGDLSREEIEARSDGGVAGAGARRAGQRRGAC